MTSRHSITPPSLPSSPSQAAECEPPCGRFSAAGHTHLLVAFLKVARTASERALSAADCPHVRHLLEQAQFNLAAADDLVETDRKWAA